MYQWTDLHIAVNSGNVKEVQSLVGKKADVNSKDKDGVSETNARLIQLI